MQELLDELLGVETYPKITLQIPCSTDPGERALRVRHQLETLAAELSLRGLEEAAVEKTVERVREAAYDPELATARSGTGGVYVAARYSRVVPWPAPLVAKTLVTNDFYLADVVGMLSSGRCHLLTLARGGVELYEADALSLEHRELTGIPESLVESSRYRDPERQLQFHQAQSVGRGGPAAIYHGHGIGEGRDVEELRAYLRAVDEGVRRTIGTAPAPMVLVGSSDVVAEYRNVTAIPHQIVLTDDHNPDAIGPAQLRELADQTLDDSTSAEVTLLRDRIRTAVGAGRAALTVQGAVGAAMRGRVDSLLIGPDHNGNDCAVNVAVVATWRHGGTVLLDANAPADQPVAALLRY